MSGDQLSAASRIYELSIQRWGAEGATVIIGRDPRLEAALGKLLRFAAATSPTLLTGETGVGKELFARALFLSSRRSHKLFLTVNCAQYTSEHLAGSELFGYRKGAFTGAQADRRGIFEEADGGVVFLDEIGELTLPTQAMLLRVLSEGEILPVGGARARKVDVRILAATNRDLAEMVAEGRFRKDLYYRLKCLTVEVPTLRQRGDDWQLIARYYLRRLFKEYARSKRLARDTIGILGRYRWPGNVRELKNLVEVGYHLSDSNEITIDDLGSALEERPRWDDLGRLPAGSASGLCERMAAGQETFWEAIHQPYLQRELNRTQVREVIAYALAHCSRGSYKRMLSAFGVSDEDYLKAMDFLRHHDLKPRP